jgi:hypothetical protein
LLAESLEVTDPVVIVKDVEMQVPSADAHIATVKMNADWSGALLGYIMQTGFNPKILHWGINRPSEISKAKVLFLQNSGVLSSSLTRFLGTFVRSGGVLVTSLDNSLERTLRRHVGRGKVFHIPGHDYDVFSSDDYASILDVPQRRQFLDNVFKAATIAPSVKIVEGGDRVVAFLRKQKKQAKYLLTIKSGQTQRLTVHVALNPLLVSAKFRVYHLTELLSGRSSEITPTDLISKGIEVTLGENGSTVYLLEGLTP